MMPRKASLANYYSSEELKHKYPTSPSLVESRRWHLLWKISLGWSIRDNAIAIGINYDSAKEIVQKCNKSGKEGEKKPKNKQRKQLPRKETFTNKKNNLRS